MNGSLMQGKVALITGASSGLGQHFARVLAGAGARVAVTARRRDKLQTLAAEINDAGGSALAVGMDVTDRMSVTDALDEITAEMAVPDVLVNNAGVASGSAALDVTDDDWHKVIDTNLQGAWIVAQETARRMRDHGGGNIINTASILGLRVSAGVAPYAISKAAVLQMTKALALELARFKIRVNALAPGYIETDLNEAYLQSDAGQAMIKRIPMRRVVTNIDPEHLDHYGNFDNLRKAFVDFVENIPFYGFAALCIDHAEVQAMIPRVSDRRIITYGFSPQADVRGENVSSGDGGTTFDVVISNRKTGETRHIQGLKLAMYGLHNVLNALSAVAIASEMGLSDAVLNRAFSEFKGVKRRFTQTGVVDGTTIIDDYGHHPVEIAAVLKAARQVTKERVIAVVQPHRYSRLRDLFEDFCTCFNDADAVIVADVYAAGETPIEGIDRDAFVAGLRERGHRTVIALDGPDALAGTIDGMIGEGDFVVCLGAGSISAWANALPDQLRALRGQPTEAQNDGH